MGEVESKDKCAWSETRQVTAWKPKGFRPLGTILTQLKHPYRTNLILVHVTISGDPSMRLCASLFSSFFLLLMLHAITALLLSFASEKPFDVQPHNGS